MRIDIGGKPAGDRKLSRPVTLIVVAVIEDAERESEPTIGVRRRVIIAIDVGMIGVMDGG